MRNGNILPWFKFQVPTPKSKEMNYDRPLLRGGWGGGGSHLAFLPSPQTPIPLQHAFGEYYTILYSISYYTILYYTILYYTILYYTMLYYTTLHYTILSGLGFRAYIYIYI